MYVTARDFLVLGTRVESLADELRVTKPNYWINLLRDRRDTVRTGRSGS